MELSYLNQPSYDMDLCDGILHHDLMSELKLLLVRYPVMIVEILSLYTLNGKNVGSDT